MERKTVPYLGPRPERFGNTLQSGILSPIALNIGETHSFGVPHFYRTWELSSATIRFGNC